MSGPEVLRIGTWNLLHGLAPHSGSVESETMAKAAALLDCDLLAIQEVDHSQPRSGNLDQTAEIAGALGTSEFRFAPALVGTPGGQWQAAQVGASGPQYGIGLISRLPVRTWHTLALPSGRMGMPLLLPTERGPRLVYVSDEPRVAIAAELDGLTVACVHLSFLPGRNIRQLRWVKRWLSALPGPHLLLGDFNLPGAIPSRVTGWTDLARTPTYPSWQPRVQFDHVLASTPWQVDSVETPRVQVSDHRPLVVQVRMRQSG